MTHDSSPFTLSGSPYRDHFEMRGRPLQPDDLFDALDPPRVTVSALSADPRGPRVRLTVNENIFEAGF